MDSINISQILANSTAFLTCAFLLGGFFFRYIRIETKKDAEAVTEAHLKKWLEAEFNPWKTTIHQDIQAVASLSNRLSQVEIGIKNLNSKTHELAVTVSDNAQQARNDLTGLASSLRTDTKNQTDLLVRLIEAKK